MFIGKRQYFRVFLEIIICSEIEHKVEKILKGSLNLIPSPSISLKIQIMGGKVCLMCKVETLLGVVNKLLKIKKSLHQPAMFCLIT